MKYLLLTVLLASYIAALVYYMARKQWQQHPLYIVARVCATIINNVLVPAIIILVCRVTHTKLSNSCLSKWLPLEFNISMHKKVGISITVLGFVHALMHAFYHPEQLLKQSGVTGIIMMLALTILGLTQRFKEHPALRGFGYHNKFLWPHRWAAFICACAYAIHVPEKAMFLDYRMFNRVVIMGMMYALDNLVEFLFYTAYTTVNGITIVKQNKTDLCSPSHDHMLLKFQTPEHMIDTEPGQFVRIRCGRAEYHTFTAFNNHKIAAKPELDQPERHEMTLLIKKHDWKVSDVNKIPRWLRNFCLECSWTQMLYKNICTNNQDMRNATVTIAGPFGASLLKLATYPQILAIGSGVGISSFGSYLNYIFDKALEIKPIKLLVSNNTSFDNFSAMTRVLSHAHPHQRSKICVRYHYTSPDKDAARLQAAIDVSQRPGVKLSQEYVCKSNADVVHVAVHNYRMDLADEIKALAGTGGVVVACGNPDLMSDIERLCGLHNVECLIERFT